MGCVRVVKAMCVSISLHCNENEQQIDCHEVRQDVRVPVELVLSYPLPYEVKCYWMYGNQHGQQTHDNRHVKEHEDCDRYLEVLM